MKRGDRRIFRLLRSACATTVVLLSVGACGPSGGAERPPNIVFILADDLGYGDVGAYNPESKIATPHIDRLARQGIRLTDVHSASTCVPTRYGLLTGRYMFRTRRGFTEGLIEPGRLTLASLLKLAGYTTAMIGKWHLGFEGLGVHSVGTEGFDYTQPLRGGPVDHGFDRYFGIHASLDVPPYFYIEHDRVVAAPIGTIQAHHTPGVRPIQGAFWRGGAIAPDFKHAEVLPRVTERAVQYLESRAGSEQPFFLYLALPAPHPPWLPGAPFRGQSGAGSYGDFVVQVDAVVGRVVTALEQAGKTGNTLVIFTSDNGPTWYETDVQRHDHRAAGGFRGMKADAWEGGHRVPFIARWPGKIPADTSSAQLISLTDMLATFASLTGQALPAGAGEDSFDVLPVLLGQSTMPIREVIVHEGVMGPSGGALAIRQAHWKLIPWLGDVSAFEWIGSSGGEVTFTPSWPTPPPGGPPGQLYNMADDPGEQRNVYAEHPDIVRHLTALLARFLRDGQTRPR